MNSESWVQYRKRIPRAARTQHKKQNNKIFDKLTCVCAALGIRNLLNFENNKNNNIYLIQIIHSNKRCEEKTVEEIKFSSLEWAIAIPTSIIIFASVGASAIPFGFGKECCYSYIESALKRERNAFRTCFVGIAFLRQYFMNAHRQRRAHSRSIWRSLRFIYSFIVWLSLLSSPSNRQEISFIGNWR